METIIARNQSEINNIPRIFTGDVTNGYREEVLIVNTIQNKRYDLTLLDCANTDAEIDIISASIPADDWSDGENLDFKIFVDALNTTPTTATIKLYYGASSITLASALSIFPQTNRSILEFHLHLARIDDAIYISANGMQEKTTKIQGDQPYEVLAPIATSWDGADDGYYAGTSANGGGGVLTSQEFDSLKTLKVTCEFAVADVGNYLNPKANTRLIKY